MFWAGLLLTGYVLIGYGIVLFRPDLAERFTDYTNRVFERGVD